MLKSIPEFQGVNITFNTTEECNMRCKYCYEIDKKQNNLKFEDAKKFIDLLLDKEYYKITNDKYFKLWRIGVVIDFIGGDSFMNVELMEKIMKYFIYKLYTTDNDLTRTWRNRFRFSISSNGTLFSNEKVKKFCEKYKDVIHVGVSIDGCPEIHDKNRIMLVKGPNGEEIGSMQYILKDWEWYQKTFPNASNTTKATMAKDTIPYIAESLKYMHENMGIDYIHQNFIMEDAHLTIEDYKEFDRQMKKSVEYILQHNNEIYWSAIDANFFAYHHNSFEDEKTCDKGVCGSGAMPCLGVNGKIYPCFRWAPHTQTLATKDKMCTGDIEKGFYKWEKFDEVSEGSKIKNCTKEDRCKTCQFESACKYCIGGCYSIFGDFVRTTYICEITKIQCKWAKVYHNELNLLKGKELRFDEKYLLKNVPEWNEKYIGTNLGD